MMEYTKIQEKVICFEGNNLLVSASAGTGKTTVMIERIARLVENGMDVSSLAVMTFTNLAAAEMKKRLYDKLSQKHNDAQVLAQMEKLDTASICTIDSFCNELLRNYFYVVDIDPAFTILDKVTVASLRKSAMDSVFAEYFKNGDEEFKRVYKIFSKSRRDENFRALIVDIFNFGRCLENFYEWYQQKRQNFLEHSGDNPVFSAILSELRSQVEHIRQQIASQHKIFEENNLVETLAYSQSLVDKLEIDFSCLKNALYGIVTAETANITSKTVKNKTEREHPEWAAAAAVTKDALAEYCKVKKKCEKLLAGKSFEQLCSEMQLSAQVTDKLVEIVQRFEQAFFALKKQRGGLDFGDLEQLALKVLNDEEASNAIRERYKYVFVDEYQDTNQLQEAIISRLSANAKLFMVGDVKQSIYGFRGCDPTIFLEKYRKFKRDGADGTAAELNTNFRSNTEILNFVNDVFDRVMTDDFGKINYKDDARLDGTTDAHWSPAVKIDLVLKGVSEEQSCSAGIYDITSPQDDENAIAQGEVIAQRIKRYVGMLFKDSKGNTRSISYGDIVILVRGMKDKAVDIYNTLVEHNIPVSASFKLKGYHNKEVRELVNLMRALDNPYNDIYVVGVCLSPFGGFSENNLAQIKIATQAERVPFLTRMEMYLGSAKNDDITHKISNIIALLNDLRFYSRSATVDEVILRTLAKTNFHLYVQGMPNGALRLRKMYNFVDGLKGAAYAQSVERFLSYLDETDEGEAEDGMSGTNAVRLMTMHASKGLEFPIVFVAGLESRFVSDSSQVECNNELGLATKFYNFENMKVSDTLGLVACRLFNKTKSLEEEMRILYVALTRAKVILNIVGGTNENQLIAPPKRMCDAKSHLEWILNTLKLKYGKIDEATNHTEEISIITEKQAEETGKEPNLLCEQHTDIEAVLRQLNYEYPFALQTQMPSKVVSSTLDREYFDVDDERTDEFVLVENGDRNFVGTAYHKVYQFITPDATMENIEEVIAGLVNEGKIDPQYKKQVEAKLIFQTLNNPQLKEILASGTVYHEKPFMLFAPYNTVAADQRFTDDVMLQGVIDLLVISADGQSAKVVDFKYSTRSEEQLRQHYRLQLNSYKLAVQKICGIENVECYILSIAQNKLVKM